MDGEESLTIRDSRRQEMEIRDSPEDTTNITAFLEFYAV